MLGKTVDYPMKDGNISDALVVGVPVDTLENMLALDEKEAILFFTYYSGRRGFYYQILVPQRIIWMRWRNGLQNFGNRKMWMFFWLL